MTQWYTGSWPVNRTNLSIQSYTVGLLVYRMRFIPRRFERALIGPSTFFGQYWKQGRNDLNYIFLNLGSFTGDFRVKDEKQPKTSFSRNTPTRRVDNRSLRLANLHKLQRESKETRND